MDDELTPEQKFAAEDPESMVPRALLEGRSGDDIISELVRLDWSKEAAFAFVERVADDLRRFHESPEARKQLVSDARRQFFGGVVITLFAAFGSTATLLAALAVGGAPFIFFTGLFFLGLILAGRGWSRWRLYSKETLPGGPMKTE